MTHDPGFEEEQLGVLLIECRRRLSDQEALVVRVADNVIRHLFAIGLQLKHLEGRAENTGLQAEIESSIELADSAISELRRMVFELQRP